MFYFTHYMVIFLSKSKTNYCKIIFIKFITALANRF